MDADAALLFETLFLIIGILCALVGVWPGYWAAMALMAVLVVEQFIEIWRR